ncbi:hypothetical protein GGR52DRAFT_568536 [Hypoxylon sp. FL1284]|nr:hypothetical protein GGR52DRAFT_568536 [Hypoxylon sp. FL1284]
MPSQKTPAPTSPGSYAGGTRTTPLSLASIFGRNSAKTQVPTQRSISDATQSVPQPVRRANTRHRTADSSAGRRRDKAPSRNVNPVRAHHGSHANTSKQLPETPEEQRLKQHGIVANPAQGRGTRGIFVPPYAWSLVSFSQAERLRNPRPLLDGGGSSRAVEVQFYHCESLYLGQELVASPEVERLTSAAAAFLGECELRGSATAAAARRHRRNPGYVGLEAAQRHGGFHIHLPDEAGATALDGNVAIDWELVVLVHRRFLPRGGPLLVGVGPRRAGTGCV